MKRTILFLSIMFLCIFSVVSGQKSGRDSKKKITISGTVTSLNHQPVAGAEIYIDSLSTGVTTNESGIYRVKTDPDAKAIFAWSLKSGSGGTSIDGRTTIDFMVDSRKSEKPSFLGRTAKAEVAKRKNPEKINTYTDIYQMIRQEVPGVLVSGRNIVVQQQNSFFGSTTPLFIVNGVRVSSLDYVNPQEVESIKLLKGSSANIYGVEGANGVIVVTLKSGTKE